MLAATICGGVMKYAHTAIIGQALSVCYQELSINADGTKPRSSAYANQHRRCAIAAAIQTSRFPARHQ
jgi:hypothetical protein